MMRIEQGNHSPLRLTVGGVALVFSLLAGLFILAPAKGAAFFGMAAEDRTALLFVRAIGFRDLALTIYLLALAGGGGARPLAILLAGTTVIPAGDLMLLANADAGSTVHRLLHVASLFLFAGLALWAHASGRRGAHLRARTGTKGRRR